MLKDLKWKLQYVNGTVNLGFRFWKSIPELLTDTW